MRNILKILILSVLTVCSVSAQTVDNGQYGLVDNLSYTYNGNQVTKVTDAVSGPNHSGAFHFRDGANATLEYEYDQNGNMTKDLNKGISSIQYNLLNLPSSINYQSGNMASYVYSASGAKLSVTYTNGATTTTNQYCGNMLYEQIREPSPDLTGNIFPTFSPANPMRSSINGKGRVGNYYQPGRRY